MSGNKDPGQPKVNKLIKHIKKKTASWIAPVFFFYVRCDLLANTKVTLEGKNC